MSSLLTASPFLVLNLPFACDTTASYLHSSGTSPPSLLVIVSGNVTYGRGPSGNPPNTPAKTVEGHPRAFSQTFMLVPDSSAVIKPGEVAKYYVSTDSLRFVG